MANEAILRIKVITDASQAALGLDQTSKNAGKFSSAMRKAALPAAAVGAAVVAMGKKAVDAASDLQQAEGAVEAVFGPKLAQQVEKYANSAARTMGLSAADYQNYAALVGTALQNAGFTASQAVEESNKVMQRGADLSALYGGTTADAVDAINAAVSRSEFDPLEKYGVSLNMTKVNALLAAKGQDKLTGAAADTAKKQAILAQIYKDTGKAAGQYAREADSVAGQTQTMKAEWTNAAAALGKVLLPAVSTAVGYLGDFAKWASENKTTVQVLAGVVLALAAAILLVNAGLKVMLLAQAVGAAVAFLGGTTAGTAIGVYALAAAEWVAAAASTAFGVAMAVLTSPIFLVVAAIALLVGGLILLYKKSDTARAIMDAMWRGIQSGARAAWSAVKSAFSGILNAVRNTYQWIRSNWPLLLAIITGPIGLAVYAVVRNWDRIRDATRNLIDRMRDIWRTLSDAVGTIIGRIREIWSNAVSAIASRAASLGSAITHPFQTAKGVIDSVKNAIYGLIGAVGSLISKLGSIHWPKPPSFLSKIPGLGSFSAAPAPDGFAARAASGAAAPMVAGRPSVRAATTSSTGGINITVNGAVDPEATARQIRRILEGSDRRLAVRVSS